MITGSDLGARGFIRRVFESSVASAFSWDRDGDRQGGREAFVAQVGERGFEHAWSVRRPWRSESRIFDAIFVICDADLPGNHLSTAPPKVLVGALEEAFVCISKKLRKSGPSNFKFELPGSQLPGGTNVNCRTSH